MDIFKRPMTEQTRNLDWDTQLIFSQAIEAIDAKVRNLTSRVTRLEPHDHTFTCTTCGAQHA